MSSIHKITILLLAIIVGSAAAVAVAPDIAARPKSAQDYFRHRTDIPNRIAGEPSFVPPQPIFQPTPVLPEGTPAGTYRLQVAFVIENDGSVKEVALMESSGREDLDAANVEMMKRFRFRPAQVHGESVAVVSRMPIRVEKEPEAEE